MHIAIISKISLKNSESNGFIPRFLGPSLTDNNVYSFMACLGYFGAIELIAFEQKSKLLF